MSTIYLSMTRGRTRYRIRDRIYIINCLSEYTLSHNFGLEL